MTKGKILLGVLAGIAAGTVIGMLVAPQKGDRARRIISRKGEDLADAINDKIEEKFEQFLNTVSGKVKKTKTSGAEASVRSGYPEV